MSLIFRKQIELYHFVTSKLILITVLCLNTSESPMYLGPLLYLDPLSYSLLPLSAKPTGSLSRG